MNSPKKMDNPLQNSDQQLIQQNEYVEQKNKCARTEDKKFWRVGAYGFLMLITIPTIFLLTLACFDIEKSMRDIRAAAISTNKVHLPKILDNQRTLVHIENLRCHIETIYNAFDSTIRQQAKVNAITLARESVFELDSRFAQYAVQAVSLINALVDEKQRTEETQESMVQAKILLANSMASLNIYAGTTLVADEFLLQPRKIMNNPKTWQLDPLLVFCAKQTSEQPELRSIFQFQIAVQCSKFQHSLAQMEDAWQNNVAADKQAKIIWKQFDDLLRRLSDLTSSTEAELTYLAMDHIGDEAELAQFTFYFSCILILLILCSFILILHRYILSPLALASRSLKYIRNGGTIDALPPVRIKELQDMFSILPMLSLYITELSLRSGLLEQEKNKFKSLSLIDGLTGVGNRRYFDMRILEIDQSHSLSLLMIDVDMFKRYNDTYGHQAGDSALIAVAQSLSNTLQRATDQVFRYGGEEFCILLPDTPESSAQIMAERLRDNICKLKIPHEKSSVSAYLTISIGISMRESCCHISNRELIERADKALYQAKTSGRNKACLYK